MITQTQVITGSLGTFVTAWGYNSAGQQITMRYPSDNAGHTGETVTLTYNNQLSLNSLFSSINSEVYVTSTAYDASGRVVERHLGDTGNLISSYVYHPWTLNGGRLQRTMTGMTGQLDSILDLRYTYDAIGNVLTIEDHKMGSPQTQTFTYDALYRLRTAVADGGLNDAGDFAQESYTYNTTTGNLASKAGLSYTYGAQSAGCGVPSQTRAHAVVQAGPNNFYCYDQNGNMTRRTLDNSVYNLAYDEENHLIEISGAITNTLSYGYNGDGARITSTNGITTTIFIGNYFEWTGSTDTMVKYYYAGSQRVAMRTGSGSGSSGLKWLLGDHLGSTAITADGATGTRVSELRYKPWGELRYAWNTTITSYRYTDQLQTGFGLIDYKARYYDPQLGRFVQPDPLIPNLYNPSSFDHYKYVTDNPIRYIDPTGHCWWDLCVGETAVVVGVAALFAAATVAYHEYVANGGPQAVGEAMVDLGEAATQAVSDAARRASALLQNSTQTANTSNGVLESRKPDLELIDELMEEAGFPKDEKELRDLLHRELGKVGGHYSVEEIREKLEEIIQLYKRSWKAQRGRGRRPGWSPYWGGPEDHDPTQDSEEDEENSENGVPPSRNYWEGTGERIPR